MTSSFDALGLSENLQTVVAGLGYSKPTPVQSEAIPKLLAGKDVLGQSRTGSGKTAAFALPILEKLSLDNRSLQALVLCPTRELGAQVAREFRKLGHTHNGLQVLEVAGGQPAAPQIAALKRGVHVVVGTPGRVLDLITRDALLPHGIDTVVLDEADRMLDMGFLADMERILSRIPKSRQTVLFSATFPDSIEEMCRVHQRNATRIKVVETEAAPEIAQWAMLAEPDRKLAALFWAFDHFPHESALVFCNFKATINEIVSTLKQAGLSVDCLHGDLDQFHRDQVLARFRNQSVRVLVATDVAGRGLDVEDLDLVVNYELPTQAEVYVHRIGRTGRAGKSGAAVSLLSQRERSRSREIEEETDNVVQPLRWAVDGPGALSDLKRSLARGSKMDTILISGGRKDKVRPGDILGALTGEAGGLQGSQVGKIEIHERLSYVAVDSSVSHKAAKSLDAGRIKKKRFRATLIK